MTTDERIAQIKKWEKCGSATALFDVYADVRFLLAELDAARAERDALKAREAKLREALKDLSIRLRPNVEAAPWVTTRIAALAEGDPHP